MKQEKRLGISTIRPLVIFAFFALLLSVSSLAGNIWENYGSTQYTSFIQPTGSTFASDNLSIETLSQSTQFSPLITDWDGDGSNEYIFADTGSVIKIYSGTNFNFVDSYSHTNLTLSGGMAFANFNSTSTGRELMVVTNASASMELWAINWNGSDFDVTKKIPVASETSNGLNCENIDNDTEIECVYYSSFSKLYAYDVNDNTNNSPIYTASDALQDWLYQSIPLFVDYDEDGDLDIFINHDNSGRTVGQLDNDGFGTYTLNREYTTVTHANMEVNSFAPARLNGVMSLVILKGNYYAKTGGFFGHEGLIEIYRTDNGGWICGNDIGGVSGTTYYGAYLTGLRTSLYDAIDTNSDWNSDGSDDIFVFAIHPNNRGNASMLIYDDSCNGGVIDNIWYDSSNNNYPVLGGDAGTDVSTGDWLEGNWGDYDNDGRYEFAFMGGVYDVEKSAGGGIGAQLAHGIMNESTTMSTSRDGTDFMITGDVTNDGYLDIIIHNTQNSPEMKMYSFGYTNDHPTLLGDGIEVDTCVPVCANETVTFYARQDLDYEDTEDDNARLGADCEGEGVSTVVWGSYAENPEVTCTYEGSGDWTTTIYITDVTHYPSFSVSQSFGMYTALSSNCYEGGEYEVECAPDSSQVDNVSALTACWTDAGINICLVDGVTDTLCTLCNCSDIAFNKCINESAPDAYDATYFNWDECESWEGRFLYPACPVFVWGTSFLEGIWGWIFGAFAVFLTLILVVLIIALLLKRR
jgi:hypothetical protein